MTDEPEALSALRLLRRLVAVVDAASMHWADPVPEDSIAAIHDSKEFLSALPAAAPALDAQPGDIDAGLLAQAIDAVAGAYNATSIVAEYRRLLLANERARP